MKHLHISLLALLCCLLGGVADAGAQSTEISPYSRFGYGALSDHATESTP